MIAAVPEPTPLAVRVLDADRDATAGPWTVEPGMTFGHDALAVEGVVYSSGDMGQSDADAAMIALYRTAAPALARQVQAVLALCEEAEQPYEAMGGVPPSAHALLTTAEIRAALGDETDA